MKYNYKTRIYSATSVSKNFIFKLDPKKFHKIFNVLRLKSGDRVKIFNEKDGEWQGKLILESNKKGKIVCEKILKREITEEGPWLIFSPIKFGRLEWLVEKATECGVSKLLPAIMNRSIIKKINTNKLITHCISAAEQSDRVSIPEILPIRSMKEQVEFSINAEKHILFCDENIKTPSIKRCFNIVDPKNLVILIGPEGGFDNLERKYLRKIKNTTSCSLGERILRADTAALVALAIVQNK